jgi:predicted nucleic acid-binding protein
MIVLDTNVISELMNARPDKNVMGWLRENPDSSLFTTALTQAELLYGIAILPLGRRRNGFEMAAHAIFKEDFSGRILAFDSDAATEYASIISTRRKAGRPISQFDCQIAAITRLHRATLATRNTADFEGCGLKLKNPWKD